MQSGSDNIFYAVYYYGYDGPAAKPSFLSNARREYFTAGRAVSVKEENFDSGVKTMCRGKLSNRGFTWSVKCGGRTVQQAFRDENGYELIRWDGRGEIVSKARFSLDQRWVSTAYYMSGRRDRLPVAVLTPQGEKLLLTEWNPDTGKYSRTELRPCPLRRGSAEQSFVDARLGEPRVWAETFQGSFCYCPAEEAVLRETLLEQRGETVPQDIAFQPDGAEEGGFADFAYIANDAEPEEERENSPVSAPEPERPPQQEDDYAADHELFSAGQDASHPAQWGTACPPLLEKDPEPPMTGREEVPLPVLNSGLSQLLKLVQAELKVQAEAEKPEPLPTVEEIPEQERPLHVERYSVAAKNRHGIVVHAPELKPKFFPEIDTEPEWEQGASPAPVKRIIISEEESYAYFGDLLNGMREGDGRTEMANGHTAYEGGYHADKRDGFGTYYYKSGKLCYVGNWKDNQRHGPGVSFSSRDGSVFVGKWKDNVPTGNGTAFDAEGSLLYTGGWKDGKRDGFGTEYRDGAAVYAGEWCEDLRHGRGTLTLKNGTVITGLFENGKVQGLDEA